MKCCPVCGEKIGRRKRVLDYIKGRGSYEVATTGYEIAQRLGMGVTVVPSLLARMEADGLITWRRGQKGGGRGLVSITGRAPSRSIPEPPC